MVAAMKDKIAGIEIFRIYVQLPSQNRSHFASRLKAIRCFYFIKRVSCSATFK